MIFMPTPSPDLQGFSKVGEWSYKPTRSEDVQLVTTMEGAILGGTIILASGAQLPFARDGFVWSVTDGVFTQIAKPAGF